MNNNNNRDSNRLVDDNNNNNNNSFSWTTLSMLTSPYHRVNNIFGKRDDDQSDIYFSSLDDLSVEEDLVYETIDNVPIFKTALIEATKAVYEMCIVVSVLSVDGNARMSARTMMKWLSANSPMLRFLDLSSTHSLIALLAKPSQYKTFLSVIEKRKRCKRYLSSSSSSSLFNSRDEDYVNDNIDFEFYKQLYEDLPEIFRDDDSNIINDDYDHHKLLSMDHDDDEDDDEDYHHLDDGQCLFSIGNTYSLLTRNNEDLKRNYIASINKIENFVKEIAKEGSHYKKKLVEGNKLFHSLSTNLGNNFVLNKRNGRQSVLEELMANVLLTVACKAIESQRESRMYLLTSQICRSKEILTQTPHTNAMHESLRCLLGLTGITEHGNEAARSIIEHLPAEDIKLFMGKTFLQKGLFLSFFLRYFLLGYLDTDMGPAVVCEETRTNIIKLLAVCQIVCETFKDVTTKGVSAKNAALTFKRAWNNVRNRDANEVRDILSGLAKLTREGREMGGIVKRNKSTLAEILTGPSMTSEKYKQHYIDRSFKTKKRRDNIQTPSLYTCITGNPHLPVDNNNNTSLFNGIYNHDSLHRYNDDDDDIIMSDADSTSDMDYDDDNSSNMNNNDYEIDEAGEEDDDDNGTSSDDDDDTNSDDDDYIIGNGDLVYHHGSKPHYGENTKSIKKAIDFIYGRNFFMEGWSLEDVLKLSSKNDYSEKNEDEEDEENTDADHREYLRKLAHFRRQFAPKDVYVDENGRIISVKLTKENSIINKLFNIHNMEPPEQKRLKTQIGEYKTKNSRTERQNIVLSRTMKILSLINRNIKKIYKVFYKKQNQHAGEILRDDIFLNEGLQSIVYRKEELIKTASVSAPTIITEVKTKPAHDLLDRSLPVHTFKRLLDKHYPEVYANWLHAPVSRLMSCLDRNERDDGEWTDDDDDDNDSNIGSNDDYDKTIQRCENDVSLIEQINKHIDECYSKFIKTDLNVEDRNQITNLVLAVHSYYGDCWQKRDNTTRYADSIKEKLTDLKIAKSYIDGKKTELFDKSDELYERLQQLIGIRNNIVEKYKQYIQDSTRRATVDTTPESLPVPFKLSGQFEDIEIVIQFNRENLSLLKQWKNTIKKINEDIFKNVIRSSDGTSEEEEDMRTQIIAIYNDQFSHDFDSFLQEHAKFLEEISGRNKILVDGYSEMGKMFSQNETYLENILVIKNNLIEKYKEISQYTDSPEKYILELTGSSCTKPFSPSSVPSPQQLASSPPVLQRQSSLQSPSPQQTLSSSTLPLQPPTPPPLPRSMHTSSSPLPSTSQRQSPPPVPPPPSPQLKQTPSLPSTSDRQSPPPPLSPSPPSSSSGASYDEPMGRNHTDLMTIAALVLGSKFSYLTPLVVEWLITSRNNLDKLQRKLETAITSSAKERTPSNNVLLSDTFNTRMRHVDGILGLISPTLFVNENIQRTSYSAVNLQTLFREINSRQLFNAEPQRISNILKIVKEALPVSCFSLYNMSVCGEQFNNASNQIAGTVNIGLGRTLNECEDRIFARPSKSLSEFCRQQRVTLKKKSVGPIHRMLPSESTIVDRVYSEPTFSKLDREEGGGVGGGAGTVITVSSEANLYGDINFLVALHMRFAELQQHMKNNNNKGDMAKLLDNHKKMIDKAFYRNTNSPEERERLIGLINKKGIYSDFIAFKAMRMMHSVLGIINTRCKPYQNILGQNSMTFSMNMYSTLVEDLAALEYHESVLLFYKNRLALVANKLKQYVNIGRLNLSSSKAAIAAIVLSYTPYRQFTVNREDTDAEMDDIDDFLIFIKHEHWNISKALNTVSVALSEIVNIKNQLASAKAICINTNTVMQYNNETNRDDDNDDENHDKKSTKEYKESFIPSHCGNYVRHPVTNICVKLEKKFVEGETTARRIEREASRNKLFITKAKLAAIQSSRPDIASLFLLDSDDQMIITKFITNLESALGGTPHSRLINPNQTQNVVQRFPHPVACRPSLSGASFDSQKQNEKYASKRVPYIPVVARNLSLPCDDISTTSNDQVKQRPNFSTLSSTRTYSKILQAHAKHSYLNFNVANLVSLFSNSDLSANPDREDAAALFHGLENSPPSSSSTSGVKTPATQHTEDSVASNKDDDNVRRVLGRDIIMESAVSELKSNTKEYENLNTAKSEIEKALGTIDTMMQNAIDDKEIVTGTYKETLSPNLTNEFSKLASCKENARANLTSIASNIEQYTLPSINNAKLDFINSDENGNLGGAILSALDKIRSEATGSNKQLVNIETMKVALNKPEIRIPLLICNNTFVEEFTETMETVSTFFERLSLLEKEISKSLDRAREDSNKQRSLDILSDIDEAKNDRDQTVNVKNTETAKIVHMSIANDNKITEINNFIHNLTEELNLHKDNQSGDNTHLSESDILNIDNTLDTRDKPVLASILEFAKNDTEIDTKVSDVIRQHPLYKNYNDGDGSGGDDDDDDEEDSSDEDEDDVESKTKQDKKKTRRRLKLTNNRSKRIDYLSETIKILKGVIEILTTRNTNLIKEKNEIEAEIIEMNNKLEYIINNLHEKLMSNIKEFDKTIEMNKGIVSDLKFKLSQDQEELEDIGHRITTIFDKAAAFRDIGEGPRNFELNIKVDGEEKEESKKSKPKQHAAATASAFTSTVPFNCFLSSLHQTISLTEDFFSKGSAGSPISSQAATRPDLQLLAITDMADAVLKAQGTRYAQNTMSTVIPGLCERCAMILFNIHTPTHESEHSFAFDTERSRKELTALYAAALADDSGADDGGLGSGRVASSVLSLLESNNSIIKKIAFKFRQRVAAFTNISSLLGLNDSINKGCNIVNPGTVLVPSSELFNCPGLANDKFRSVVNRCHDPALSHALKASHSIVHTLASISPNAEKLYFVSKDERRYFNSIVNAVLVNMDSLATSLLNTSCDQNLVELSKPSGLPIFIGRGGKGTPNVVKLDRGLYNNNINSKKLDLKTTMMVAHGCNLHRNKDEHFTYSKLSSLNNVSNLGCDVHLATSTVSNMLIGLLRSVIGDAHPISPAINRAITLSAISILAADKSSLDAQRSYPQNPLRHYRSVCRLVDRAISGYGTNDGDDNRNGNTETSSTCNPLGVFMAPLAYRKKYFINGKGKNLSLTDTLCRHMPFMKSLRRITNGDKKRIPYNLAEDPEIMRQIDYITSENNKSFGKVHHEELLDALARLEEKKHLERVREHRPSVYEILLNKRTYESNKGVLASNLALDTMMDNFVDVCSLFSVHSKFTNMVLTKPKRILDVERIFNETTTLLSQHRANRTKKRDDSDDGAIGSAPALRTIFDSLYNNITLISPDNNRDVKRFLVSDVRQLALNLNEEILSRNIDSVEEAINAKLLKELVSDVKLAYNVTNAIDSSTDLKSLGNVLRKGFIDASVSEDVEIFKRSSILSRYMLLDERCQLFPISAETKELLLEGSSQAATARAILSESNQLLTDAVMYNTRDTPVEKAVDRVLLLPYLVKQGRDFDDVDRTLPVAITNCSSLMLSLLDSQSMSRSPFMGGLMGHVTDTTSVFKNVERFERLTGRLGDVTSMLHHQNCNCPFRLHHCSDRTEEENLMPSFIHFEDEIDKCEILKTPYQVHVLLAIKNYVAGISRIDPSVGGPSVIRRLREWSDMGAGTRYIGSFIADRKTVQDSPFRVAGSNLDVIVRPAAARGILGILKCHRQHFCTTDLKLTTACEQFSSLRNPKDDEDDTDNDDDGTYNDSSRNSSNSNGSGNSDPSTLIQHALPPNIYIQKSRMNSALLVFSNILTNFAQMLSNEILNELIKKLGSPTDPLSINSTIISNISGAERYIEDAIKNHLSPYIVSSSSTNASRNGGESDAAAAPKGSTVTTAIKQSICNSLRSYILNPDVSTVPYRDAGSFAASFEFLMGNNNTTNNEHKNDTVKKDKAEERDRKNRITQMFNTVFAAIADGVDRETFAKIVSSLEHRLAQVDAYRAADSGRPSAAAAGENRSFGSQIRNEISRVVGFLRVLQNNVIPLLKQDAMAKKIKLYFSLIATQSKLDNYLKYALSNSGSTDLTHLTPITPTVHIEDTLLYNKVHPLLVLAFPSNCAALLQQEQINGELAVEARRPLTVFLNHQNTKPMTDLARVVLGAGGGNSGFIGLATHILHENTLVTKHAVVDTCNDHRMYEIGQDKKPVLTVDPFSAGRLSIRREVIFGNANKKEKKEGIAPNYLQVSCPTQHSGVVTNTGIDDDDQCGAASSDTFPLTLRDGRQINLKPVRPAVLVSDASTNILKTLARANASLEDVSTTVGLLPELLTAIALFFKKNVTEIISDMVSKSSSAYRVDPATGDVTVDGGRLPVVNNVRHDGRTTGDGSDDEIRGPAPWQDMAKIHVRNILNQLISNPLSHIMVQGDPVGNAGIETVERKMKMDVLDQRSNATEDAKLPLIVNPKNSGDNVGGDDRGTAAIDTEKDSAITQFKESMHEINRLQDVIITKASTLKEELERNNSLPDSITDEKIKAIEFVLKAIKRAQHVIKDEIANYYATNDIVSSIENTMTRYRDENVGFLRMIDEADEFDMSNYNIENILDIIRPIKNNNNNKLLSTLGGKTNQEHNMIIGSGDSLMTSSLVHRTGQQNRVADGLSSNLANLYEAFINNPTVREAIMDKLYPVYNKRTRDSNNNQRQYQYNRLIAENILIENKQIFQTVTNILNASSGKFINNTSAAAVEQSRPSTVDMSSQAESFNQLYTKNII